MNRRYVWLILQIRQVVDIRRDVAAVVVLQLQVVYLVVLSFHHHGASGLQGVWIIYYVYIVHWVCLGLLLICPDLLL